MMYVIAIHTNYEGYDSPDYLTDDKDDAIRMAKVMAAENDSYSSVVVFLLKKGVMGNDPIAEFQGTKKWEF